MINSSLVLHVCPTCFARFRSHADLQQHERLSHRRQMPQRGWRIRARHLMRL